LIAIAIVATIGELIPQGEDFDPSRYAGWLSAVIVHLGFDRLYTSTLFLLILAVLMLNLLACAGRAWRRAWAQYRGPSMDAARRLPLAEAALKSDLPAAEAAGAIERALAPRRYTMKRQAAGDGEVLLVGLKHRHAAFGTILTHYSLFVLAAGAILGCAPRTSLDTVITVAEGETYRDDKARFDLDVTLHTFDIEYHPGDGSVSKYASDVTIARGGKELQSGTITVNRPMKVGGLSFFQIGWGLAGFSLRITTPTGERRECFLPLQEGSDEQGERAWYVPQSDMIVWLAEGKAAIAAHAFVPDAAVRGDEAEYPRNPAVMLIAASDFKKDAPPALKQLGWLMSGNTVEFQGYKIRLGEVRKLSTLGVRRDMGLPFVWLGFTMLMIGLLLQLYMQPRIALVRIRSHGKGSQVAFSLRGGQSGPSDDDTRAIREAITKMP
jgi:cytochrome c biogenesis protein